MIRSIHHLDQIRYKLHYSHRTQHQHITPNKHQITLFRPMILKKKQAPTVLI